MKTYFETELGKLYQGNTLNVLKKTESESVQMIVTSPPYWGLRDYGLEPVVWDDPGNCVHEWGDEPIKKYAPKRDHNGAKDFGDTRGIEPSRAGFKTELKQGQFCIHCNAWRGSLGLEPTPDLYVQHIVQIFREVKRVLRKDGTLWLNLGSSMMGSGGAHKEHHKNPGISKSFERYGGSSTSHQSPSPDASHGLACGTDGKEQSSSMENGRACLDSGGESQDGCLSHHHCIFHNSLQNPQCALRSLLKDHDTWQWGSVSAFLGVLLPFFQESTILSSVENAQGVSFLGAKALVSLLRLCSSSPGFLESSHTLACISDIFQKLLPSDCHIRGTVLSFLAYQNPPDGLIRDSLANGYPKVKFKPKDLIPIPWMVAMALQADGWYLRSAMPWVKRSAMPESIEDRPASALEYIFLLTKSERYFFDMEAIKLKPQRQSKVGWKNSDLKKYSCDDRLKKQGTYKDWRKYCPTGKVSSRNFRNADLFFESLTATHGIIFCGDEPVGIDVNPEPFSEAHFATFAQKLITPLILAGTSEKGCCPECGAPWVRVVDKKYPAMRKTSSRTPTGQSSQGILNNNRFDDPIETKTIGWKPGCKCLSDDCTPGPNLDDGDPLPFNPIPCSVLDLFAGACTTWAVCNRYNRNFIGIELSKKYCEMSKNRIKKITRQRKLF